MATRRLRNKRGVHWGISAHGTRVTEVWSSSDTETGSPESRTKELASKAEAQRFMKARIAAKLKEGFVDEALRRTKQRRAQGDLKDRIAAIKAAAIARKQDALPKRKPTATLPSRPEAKASPKERKASSLPPSYLKCLKRYGTDAEFERKLSPGRRRSPKAPGYPVRLILYPPNRLERTRKLFRKSLTRSEDLVKQHDHSHLLPFGDDTEQTWICWDPEMQRPNGEMMICFIDGEQGDKRNDAGYDLERILSAYRRPAS